MPDSYDAIAAQYGIGGVTSASAPVVPAEQTAGQSMGGAADPYATVAAQYGIGGAKPQERTPAEQRSDKAYGPQSTASDIQQSAEAGVPKAIAGLIGLPSAIGSLRDAATAWSLKKAGYTDDQVSQMMHHLTQLDIIGKNLPTAEGTKHVLETASGGAPIYEPQTGAGKFVGRA